MNLRFEYLPYKRKFLRPLATSHGDWRVRKGIIIRLEDADGRLGFGEIAPVPWFGTETQEDALAWCREQPTEFQLLKTPVSALPCCGFAVASALTQLGANPVQRNFPVAALLSPNESIENKLEEGYTTFKAKIGVRTFAEEMAQVEIWSSTLLPHQFLRLDANGGLSETDFSGWLEFLEGKPVEFLEQPLAVGLENRMLEMAELFSTPIALDESVSNANSLAGWSTWPGPLVVKPSLLGTPPDSLPNLVVGSSVFETAFGYEAALQFLGRHQSADTALGFGTPGFLESDGWSLHPVGSEVQAGLVSLSHLQALWEEKV
ncbi:MAG: o-succinylbenzoate synthase [Verrucomicrobia bacterium]|nr:o-succinylbenzoate synthase [Verrucomicrobiota bacterium]MDA1065121.1 o-succinylbenzoate synthase [Verrucomicrobiota bacterium]